MAEPVNIDDEKAKRNIKPGVLPTAKVLKSLASKMARLRDKAQDVSTEKSEAMRDAVDNHRVHKGAMALSVKLLAMSPDKANAFLQHFDQYREVLKLDRDELGLTGEAAE